MQICLNYNIFPQKQQFYLFIQLSNMLEQIRLSSLLKGTTRGSSPKALNSQA